MKEQEKSSDIEQQPPFRDRKYSNSLPQKRGDTNQREHHINLDQVWSVNIIHNFKSNMNQMLISVTETSSMDLCQTK